MSKLEDTVENKTTDFNLVKQNETKENTSSKYNEDREALAESIREKIAILELAEIEKRLMPKIEALELLKAHYDYLQKIGIDTREVETMRQSYYEIAKLPKNQSTLQILKIYDEKINKILREIKNKNEPYVTNRTTEESHKSR